MSYELIWMDKGVIADFQGVLDNSELRKIVAQFYGNSKFDLINYLLIDLEKVNEFNITADELLAVGAMDSAAALSNPEVIIAVVTNGGGIRNLFKSYELGLERSSWKVNFFSSTSEAKKYLLIQ
ncbi:MAG: hypothetical protein OQL19_13550 [Gammaproteobacteria bacterium]|nr:hypothetical protein [Gammaproteobacteria bacterium]